MYGNVSLVSMQILKKGFYYKIAASLSFRSLLAADEEQKTLAKFHDQGVKAFFDISEWVLLQNNCVGVGV